MDTKSQIARVAGSGEKWPGGCCRPFDPGRKRKQRELSQHSAEIYAAVIAQFQQAKPDPAKLALLKQQQQQAESALQTFTDSLYSKYPGSKDRAAAATATLQDVSLLLSSDTALLEYVL